MSTLKHVTLAWPARNTLNRRSLPFRFYLACVEVPRRVVAGSAARLLALAEKKLEAAHRRLLAAIPEHSPGDPFST